MNSYYFPGWHENAKTFRDNVCQKLGPKEGFSINKEACKAKCLKDPQCNAFNFAITVDSSSEKSDCRMKACPFPIVAPTDSSSPAYKGYYQTGRFHTKAF